MPTRQTRVRATRARYSVASLSSGEDGCSKPAATTTQSKSSGSANRDVGETSKPQLDLIGSSEADRTCHRQRMGRLLSASSAASRNTSTNSAKADSVKLFARIKPTRNGLI